MGKFRTAIRIQSEMILKGTEDEQYIYFIVNQDGDVCDFVCESQLDTLVSQHLDKESKLFKK